MSETRFRLIRDSSELVDACYGVLKSLEVNGARWGKEYHFVRPALTKYGPYQWLWDSGWHIIVWSHRFPEKAVAELRTLLQFQRPDGFIPEIIFWQQTRFSGALARLATGYSRWEYTDLTQMPMLAYSVRAIWEATQDRDLLREFVPEVAKFLEWWQSRDHDRDGLVSILHPWESGMDASPSYDPVFRLADPGFWTMHLHFWRILRQCHRAGWDQSTILRKEWFNVEDVGVCSVQADGWSVLASLAQEFDQALAVRCREQYEQSRAALIRKCWDPERRRFVSLFHRGGEELISQAETIQTLFPILLSDLPADILESLLTNLRDPHKFWLPFPVPSVARSESAFNPRESGLLWRGPTWPCANWLILEGLLKHGFRAEAEELLDRWITLYRQNGIWEYYDPLSGKGLGQPGFGMSTIIVDIIDRLKMGSPSAS